MKKLLLVLVITFAFCSMAMANDIAFYVGQWNTDGWYDATQFDDVDTIIAQAGQLFNDIQQFDDNQFNEFGAWVDARTNDGAMDIIWLNGCTPSVLYANPNVNPDGSRAEEWLDGGNMIINVGDWFGYCTWEGGTRGSDNAGAGAENMLDLSGPIAGSGQGQMVVTQAGQDYLPSLNAVTSDRPFNLGSVVAPWEVAEIFAQNAAGTHADPVVIHNTETDGYFVAINQASTANWINDRGLTCAEFINNWVSIVMNGNPYARRPSPEDGGMITKTWSSMSWAPGDFAVSHNVYFGNNFDDVNDGTGDTFQGNQGSVYFVAGIAGYAFPDGLVYGETYYWRIDEVNDTDPNSPWKGEVWSYRIQPLKAYDPVPGDGGKFVDTEGPTLSWTAGSGAVLHTVYFSDNFDDVNDSVGGTQTPLANFSPGPLEIEKTYYWRVDELATMGTNQGDVWSFTTAKVGGGVRGDYYHWNDPSFVGGGGNPGPGQAFTTFILTRTDPQIDFTFVDSPDPTMNIDMFSARWSGEVEAAFTETYTFETNTDDGSRLWIDGRLIVDQWVDQGPTPATGTIDLVAGNSYSLVMEYYENGGGAVAELRWSSLSTPKQIIPQAALSPPIKASSPNPSNGATGTKLTPILRWGAGDFAASHNVYFGTDPNAVRNADKSSPEYKDSKVLGDEIYDPGKLAWATNYFWRIDEVNALNPDSPWIGNLWSFTTGDFIVVDHFEDYNADDNQIWFSWHDGLGAGAPGTPDFVPSNGTGSAVGDETTTSYTEETIVHSGNQSMPFWYDNNKQGFNMYSEAELTLTAPRDWTEENVGELSIWFRGYPASTGSFVEAPFGTYTINASGTDIWYQSDEFHYAYKTLTGAGSITARVDSLQNTNDWAKAGVMIRETLGADSAHAYMVVTPTQGVSFQRRPSTGADSTSDNSATTDEAAPYWVKIDRTISGSFTASSSTNGATWQTLGTPQSIAMGSTVYIGLALTSHDAALTCEAVFSNVTTTSNVVGQWAHQDIGIESNAAEPLYVAVSNSTGTSAVVVNDDPAAANIETWTEWVIPLQDFTDQGINLTNVDRIAIGLGTRDNTTIPGGSGKMYFDDIRLYRPREVVEE